MKKRGKVIGLISVILIGGGIVKGEMIMHQEKIEQQRAKEAQEKEEQKELNYRIARYLIQNIKFEVSIQSIEFSKKYHYTEWSDEYSVDLKINRLSKYEMRIYIENLNKKFNSRNISLAYDGNMLELRKNPLSNNETERIIKQIELSSWSKKNNE